MKMEVESAYCLLKKDLLDLSGAVILEGLCVTFDRAQGVITFSESACGPSVTLSETHNTEGSNMCNMAQVDNSIPFLYNFLK